MQHPINFRSQSPLLFKKFLGILTCLLGAAAIFWICTFKIMDRDFWWHITAGEVMLSTHRLIATDPFAYTRSGLPYLATHEWLAQIILYIIYHLGGPTGIILFRGVVACTTTGLLLLLSPRRVFPNILLAVWAVVMAKGAFLERPQLFTFVLFSCFILLAFRFLDTQDRRAKIKICIVFAVLELLWVNMHGAAALLGCAVVSFLFLQQLWNRFVNEPRDDSRTLGLLAITLAGLSIILILPPNGLGTLTYLSGLLTDKTIEFIAEWKPRDLLLYLKELWPFFLLAFATLFSGRRHIIFNGLLLGATLYLSRQAFRHELLFILASLATVFYQMEHSTVADGIYAWAAKYHNRMIALSIVLVLILGRTAYLRSMGFERQDNLFGFGQFDLARGATDFLEREHITGNMFNTYGIGGYLIHRGYPDRKVFIDGRNVDYGYDFMLRTYAAGANNDHWDELVHYYDISYAVVDYDAIRATDSLPYSSVLEHNPAWALTYLDDWVAVYLKKTPANEAAIKRLQYSFVTATDLQFRSAFQHIKESDKPALVEELRRIQNENPEGIKATIALSSIALSEKRTDDALALAQLAHDTRPFSPEPYAIFGTVFVTLERWEDAANAYEQLLRLAGDQYPDINYGFIADIQEKAGHMFRAWMSRSKAPALDVPNTTDEKFDMPLTATGVKLMANPALDSMEFNEQGLAAVEQKHYDDAEKFFLTALKLNPSNADIWNNLCALRLNLKRYPEAIDACIRAIEIDTENADAHFNLALAYYLNGSLKNAEKEALIAKEFGRVTEGDQLLLLIHKKMKPL